jgi:hypothetical protein
MINGYLCVFSIIFLAGMFRRVAASSRVSIRGHMCTGVFIAYIPCHHVLM